MKKVAQHILLNTKRSILQLGTIHIWRLRDIKLSVKNALGEDVTFEDSIRMSMSEARYRQDYLAEELAELNSVFPHYEKGNSKTTA